MVLLQLVPSSLTELIPPAWLCSLSSTKPRCPLLGAEPGTPCLQHSSFVLVREGRAGASWSWVTGGFTCPGASDPLALPQEHIRDITDSLIGHCQERKTAGEDTNLQPSNQSIIAIVNDLFGAGEAISMGAAPSPGCAGGFGADSGLTGSHGYRRWLLKGSSPRLCVTMRGAGICEYPAFR